MACGMPAATPAAEANCCHKKKKQASQAYGYGSMMQLAANDAAETARGMPSTVLLCSIAAAMIVGMPVISTKIGPLAVQDRFAAAAVVFAVTQMFIRIVTTSEAFLIDDIMAMLVILLAFPSAMPNLPFAGLVQRVVIDRIPSMQNAAVQFAL